MGEKASQLSTAQQANVMAKVEIELGKRMHLCVNADGEEMGAPTTSAPTVGVPSQLPAVAPSEAIEIGEATAAKASRTAQVEQLEAFEDAQNAEELQDYDEYKEFDEELE